MLTTTSLPLILLCGAIPGSLFVLAFFLLSVITPFPRRTKRDFLQDRLEYDPSGIENVKFPKLFTPTTDDGVTHTEAELYLSVIVPAMNEEERLPIMLERAITYLNTRASESSEFTFEIIVVDDGSSDETSNIAHGFQKSIESLSGSLHVLKLPENVGKGGAVRSGVCVARGQMILFVDADGATEFTDFGKLETSLRDCCSDGEYFEADFPALAVGSRAHLEEESKATRSLFRTILMKGFHVIVYLFTVKSVRDTQCGFKLFSRSAAAILFSRLHIERWAFDVELLYLAERANMAIAEVGVQWTEIPGSKVTPIISWIQMGRDILLIWFRYTSGIWSDQHIDSIQPLKQE